MNTLRDQASRVDSADETHTELGRADPTLRKERDG